MQVLSTHPLMTYTVVVFLPKAGEPNGRRLFELEVSKTLKDELSHY